MKRITGKTVLLTFILSGVIAVGIFFWVNHKIKTFLILHKPDPEAGGIIFGGIIAIGAWYFIFKFITTMLEERAYRKADEKMFKNRDRKENSN
jgi:hypothetical protein